MKMRLSEEVMAMRLAKEFFDGAIVNLGYGLPTLAANFIPEGKTVVFHTENGALGFGPTPTSPPFDWDLVNASGQPATPGSGMSFFDHAASFAMIRGGHIDIAVLGALQVSEKGDLANWTTGKRPAAGPGGAVDLAIGAKRVVVLMSHVAPDGSSKIVNRCTYPLTAKECVSLVITDMAVIEVTGDGLVLKEIAPGFSPDEIQQATEPRLIISPDMKEIEL